MLVLARKRNQGVTLRDKHSGEILGTVIVSAIRGDQVRLGFDFPRHIEVMREEIDTPEAADMAETRGRKK